MITLGRWLCTIFQLLIFYKLPVNCNLFSLYISYSLYTCIIVALYTDHRSDCDEYTNIHPFLVFNYSPNQKTNIHYTKAWCYLHKVCSIFQFALCYIVLTIYYFYYIHSFFFLPCLTSTINVHSGVTQTSAPPYSTFGRQL
jgi:hypothetical protein